MIQSTLEITENVLRARIEYLTNKQDAEHLRSTQEKLREVGSVIERFAKHYSLVAPCLAKAMVDAVPVDFGNRIADCRQRLLESKASFAKSPYQVTALSRVLADINKLDQELLLLWKRYVDRTIRPKRELYDLLAELEEIQKNKEFFEQSFTTLQESAEALPNSKSQLESFDSKLTRITVLLTSVDGITPVIQDFLTRVHTGTFTIADLNDEILAWCRVNDRGRSFRIKA